MRRLSLSTILVALNVGALLVAVIGVAVVATQLLQRLGDDQALARVAQAGVIARRDVENEHAAVLMSAQLLAERPTLQRLLDQNDSAALTKFLDQFQQTSQLDGCSTWVGDRLIASSGASWDWDALWNARQLTEPRLLLVDQAGQGLILAAWSTLPTHPDRAVLVVRRLDSELMQQISEDVGLPVTIAERMVEHPQVEPAQAALRARALAIDDVATARIDERGSYQAIVPLHAPSGAMVGLLETSLPTDDIARSVQRLIQTLLVLAAAVGALAALGNFLLGRRLTRPLGTLTGAAARMGRGDLATPMPLVAHGEIATLATTVEEMRHRLRQSTTDLRRQQAEAQAIVQGINEGVFTVDRERRIRYLNGQAAALLGVNDQAVLGRFCGDVLHPQGPDGVRPCEEHCPILHARFRGSARATEHLLLNGQRRTVVITSAPATDDQQVQVLRDETETEAVRRVRDTVLANISHEFRTPLSAQLASIELLLDQLPTLSVE
jgi:PAS domain-containing protein